MKFRIPKIINLERFIKHKSTREWVEAFVFALVFATVFRTWLYSPFRVPTGSMNPTIQVGDQIFANMHYYGFVVPFTDLKLFESNEVERGDVIIFPSPQNPEICDNSFYAGFDTVRSLFAGFFDSGYVPVCIDFIKRAVALGGDEVEIIGERVWINGQIERGYVPYLDRSLPSGEIYHSEIVPEGYVFALGDNRRNSHDSRYWNADPAGSWGYVEKSKVRARATFIYLSLDPEKPFWSGVNTDRMFKALE